jgi:hypothetical protein
MSEPVGGIERILDDERVVAATNASMNAVAMAGSTTSAAG